MYMDVYLCTHAYTILRVHNYSVKKVLLLSFQKHGIGQFDWISEWSWHIN